MKRLTIVLLFALSLVGIKCSKDAKQVPDTSGGIQEFVHSPVYKDFLDKNRLKEKVDLGAARVVKIDSSLATVHIPVMEQRKVAAAIIGLPLGKGRYELMYQDNREALSGTGKISLYGSSNDLFAHLDVKQGKIRSFDLENYPGTEVSYGAMRVDCGFLCRLNRCYVAVKAQFPTEVVCDMLDMFLGVCSSATVATCLIKMAK
jgi:hypothetical protein